MRTALTLLAVIAFAGSCSLLAVWVGFGVLFWALRDGLGPDSVETTGWAAVGRFAWAWGMPAGTLASSAVASSLLYRRLRRGAWHPDKTTADGTTPRRDRLPHPPSR